ncbi:MAG: hypothetical protein ABIO37_14490, partial [Caulobacteraceae bacterium]
MLAGMLGVMSDRGPDSAGFAVYGAGEAGAVKLTLRSATGAAMDELPAVLSGHLGHPVIGVRRDTHLVLSISTSDEPAVRAWITANRPDVGVVGAGKRIELYKEVGMPADVAARFELERMGGTHGIGHTRMATESAVTTRGAHPFSTGPDQCLVHNGSL